MTTDGGPAFPRPSNLDDAQEGMSLRDWFAGQALTGLIARPTALRGQRAILAYRYANAMLKARTEEPA